MSTTKPILKCAGGKRGIINELVSRLPKKFNRYFEPFLGGGALFFEIQPKNAYISDLNPDFMDVYFALSHDVDSVIAILKSIPYSSIPGVDLDSTKMYYDAMRSMDRAPGYRNLPVAIKAARIIYLNRTCYNGLFRVNSKGQFNVPFGKYANPKIVDAENLIACGKLLRRSDVRQIDYTAAIRICSQDDFVYFDPPYLPVSDTSNFTSYTTDGFSLEDHQNLAKICRKLDKKGVKFMLSNSNSDQTKSLYDGFQIEEVAAPRSINRQKSTDIIVRNY